uniref:(d)CMP kinase n=1 Tax=Prevotella sp. TaxID=59823 RepID=UPI003FEF7EF8
MKKSVIAIDGYSSCGKSTMAKELAHRLGYVYVDTGAMYRSVTLFALREHLFDAEDTLDADRLSALLPQVRIDFRLTPETGHAAACLNGEHVEQKLRGLAVSRRVSIVAAQPFVREMLVRQQQAMGEGKGIVMDGRDIGTVVFPKAELKIFVTASAEVRAERRYKELQAKGQPADYESILKNVQDRDYMDSHREVSPLRQADDAIILDNSHLTIAQQDAWLMDRVREKLAE